MKALVKESHVPGLVLKDVPMPIIGDEDVLIRIKKTAICGTDLHIYNWDAWAESTIQPPLIAGHEYIGEIVQVGSHVKGFTIGERVSGEGHIVCGHCRNCLAGRRHNCPNTLGVGVNRDGAFAEYLALPYTNVWRVSREIDDDTAACFDPLGNAVHTALSFDLVGEDVFISGAGPIGIMSAAICRHVGARNIVISDINPYRLEMAKSMGVTRTYNPLEEHLPDVMKELGMKEGFDVGLEMSGAPSAFNEMLENMVNRGHIALLGFLPPDTGIDWNHVILKGLELKGIYGREMFETWYKMSAMLESGLDVHGIITHQFDIIDYEKGFKVMNDGVAGKVILDWQSLWN
ncbi:MAG: L-threonine 3-dehydrogenase [Clostridiales bacterium]|nr:L-threonine 3-dehydrogenase [Clostridiales bacterium]